MSRLGRLGGDKLLKERGSGYFAELGRKSAEKKAKRRGFRKRMGEISRLKRSPKQPDKFCRRCGNPLAERNNSEFCRACQRAHGMATLIRNTMASDGND